MDRRFSTSVAMTALLAVLAGPVATLPMAAAAQQAPAPDQGIGGSDAAGQSGADQDMSPGERSRDDWPDQDRDRDRGQARDRSDDRNGDQARDRNGDRDRDRGDERARAEAPPPLPGPETLPRLLLDLGMRPGEARPTRHGTLLEGEMPDGTRLEAWVDDEGELRGLRSDGQGPLPPPVVERLVPRTVLDQPILSELGRLEAVFAGDRGVMLIGRDAQGNKVRAAFAPDGTLMRFGRGDGDGRMGMGPGDRHGRDDGGHDRDGRGHDQGWRDEHDGKRDGKRGDDGERWHEGRDGGPQGGHGPGRAPGDEDRPGADRPGPDHRGPEGHEGRGDRPGPGGDRGDHGREGRFDDAPRGADDDRRGDGAGSRDWPADAPRAGDAGGPAGRDRDRIRAALDEAGYTDVGQILRQGPVGVAQATNPEGERVLVEIGPDGEIVRELNR